jgi:GT2 family glycosyltransferase
MEKKIELSIIVINYNTSKLTKNCINSVISQANTENFEILLVDNGSLEFIKTDFLDIDVRIKVIENTVNCGFGRANNQAMSVAKGDYILLLNSDTEVLDGCIGKCLNTLNTTKDVSILNCRQINGEGSDEHLKSFYFRDHTIRNYLISNYFISFINDRRSGNRGDQMMTESMYVKNVSGAFMMLRRAVFESTNGFDPDFFLYYEETEWCKRLLKTYKFYYFHDAHIVHFQGKSAPRPVMLKQMHLSFGLYWMKSGLSKFICFLGITYFMHIPAWILATLFSFKMKTIRHFIKYIKLYISLLPYFLFKIKFNSINYGGRKDMLKLKELQS